ncbi:NUDIX hydrolase [Neobacillus cucumis]|uniref:NUDIX domain-containing protein n=1 Tax=Neobacillus cucumis TaxID=1740721 RepID=UPI00203E38E9|nr:NUDIX domain-containing protein [Neobacillus cucumis]MCM3728991.1 NUDIX hydrolase [Neobacillus cucumis]
MSANFCLKCGTGLEFRDIDGTKRKACPRCDFIFWGDYSVGVGALVIKDEKFLLVKRAHNPGKGYWTNPGGYIEQLESIEDTIIREVEEESGIKAKVKGIVAIRDLPRNIHNLYVAFAMEYMCGIPRPDGVESDEAGFYSLEEIESMNVAPFTRWLIQVAYHGESKGLIKDNDPVVPIHDSILFKV